MITFHQIHFYFEFYILKFENSFKQKIDKFIGFRSSSFDHDIRNVFQLSKNRFSDLQKAIDYIQLMDTGTKMPEIEQPTLGYLLTAKVKYVNN